jgi:hypothetical protein
MRMVQGQGKSLSGAAVEGRVATMNGRLTIGMLAGLAMLALSAVAAEEREEPTAFALIEQGNDHVGIDSKDKVVQIRSERSVGGIVPNIWYIVYYDPDARFRATEVKFGAGRKLDVKRPTRLFERVGGTTAAMERERLKIDSDEAIAIALKEPMLERLTILASELRLERAGGRGGGDEGLPVWRVKLWAERLNRPGRQVDIGEVILSAEDGKVLEADLRIRRVD